MSDVTQLESFPGPEEIKTAARKRTQTAWREEGGSTLKTNVSQEFFRINQLHIFLRWKLIIADLCSFPCMKLKLFFLVEVVLHLTPRCVTFSAAPTREISVMRRSHSHFVFVSEAEYGLNESFIITVIYLFVIFVYGKEEVRAEGDKIILILDDILLFIKIFIFIYINITL